MALPKTTTVLMVDDHRIVREGLRILLEGQPDIRVIGEAATAEEAVRTIENQAPDIVVMDLHLPGDSGIVAARGLLAGRPEMRIVILTSSAVPSEIQEALQAGVVGYVLKENAWEDLVRAIRAIVAGKIFLCPDSTTAMVRGAHSPAEKPVEAPGGDLSERDIQLLRLVAEGSRNKEIADQLGLSVKSVETYRSRLMEKLGCSSPADLVRFAIRQGLVEP
jgi:two-component system, NarL family, response regulator NreC